MSWNNNLTIHDDNPSSSPLDSLWQNDHVQRRSDPPPAPLELDHDPRQGPLDTGTPHQPQAPTPPPPGPNMAGLAGGIIGAAADWGKTIWGNTINQVGSNVQNVVSQQAQSDRLKQQLAFERERLGVNQGDLALRSSIAEFQQQQAQQELALRRDQLHSNVGLQLGQQSINERDAATRQRDVEFRNAIAQQDAGTRNFDAETRRRLQQNTEENFRGNLDVARGNLAVGERLGQSDLALRRDALAFQREQWEREWLASQQAGLFSPSQLNQDNGVGRTYGRHFVRTVRAPRWSVYR